MKEMVINEETIKKLTQRIEVLEEEAVNLKETLEAVERRARNAEKKVNNMKLKNRIKNLSKMDNFFGKCVKAMIFYYRIGWRYIYCQRQLKHAINNKKISFISHNGKQYSCNPKYIFEYLVENYPGQFEYVWAFNKPNDFKYLQELFPNENITLVSRESKQHLQELVTSRVMVTNVDMYSYLPVRDGQLVLDTWHGGGSYKTCGFANEQNLKRWTKRKHFKTLYSKINLYCSSSKAFSEETIKKSRLYDGEILEVGMPRNDMLVKNDWPNAVNKVRSFFKIVNNEKIVLYAPTYRSKAEISEMEPLSPDDIKHVLTRRFGGEWIVLFRQHHLGKLDSNGVVDATCYPDMQELLYAADVLISDYSSCIWDFSLMHKPIFLYCPDLDKYTLSRDFYTPITEWPYILCRSNQSMLENIINFNQEEYLKAIEKHHCILGNCESGEATKIVCEKIVSSCLLFE